MQSHQDATAVAESTATSTRWMHIQRAAVDVEREKGNKSCECKKGKDESESDLNFYGLRANDIFFQSLQSMRSDISSPPLTAILSVE